MVRTYEMQDGFKYRTKACLYVANAKVIFSSHSGIAYFAKVSGRHSLPEGAEHTLLLMSDDLYICDACDTVGVTDLVRRSEKHTEDHHLIRCLAPEKNNANASPTERRLTSIEGHLNGVQTQLDDLTGRVGDLTDRMGDLHARIGNIEQLLHRLVRATEGRTL